MTTESSRRNIRTGKKYSAIVIGLSSGGMDALKMLIRAVPPDFDLPIIICQHLSPLSDSQWIGIIGKNCAINVKEADEKEKIFNKNIYIAPPNYHLLIESDHTFSLTIDPRESYARPSIDVLFQSAAFAYGPQLVGVVLTGSNHDGAAGLKQIRDCGGLCLVEDPKTAFSSYMPAAAMAVAAPHYVLELRDLINFLIEIDSQN